MSGRKAVVVVASTRAASGVYEDTTGPILRDWLEGRGWTADVVVLPDGDAIGEAIGEAIARHVPLVVTTGGTGVAPRDRTPELTAPFLDLALPGIAEELRRRGIAQTPTAALSRGVAGVAGRTFVVNLAGSPGAVRTGIEVLENLLDHVVEQLRGGDHERHD
jgi:molybdenum cofactor synthesis domain-containing protein